MIQPLHTQLSSAKPRTGLQSIGDLIPRLIRQYEIQAELTQQREAEAQRKQATMDEVAMIREAKQVWESSFPATDVSMAEVSIPPVAMVEVQQSFGW